MKLTELIQIPSGESYAWKARTKDNKLIEEFVTANSRNSIPELDLKNLETFNITNNSSEFGFNVETGEFILSFNDDVMATPMVDKFKLNILVDGKTYTIGNAEDSILDNLIMYRSAMQVVGENNQPAVIASYHVGYKRTVDSICSVKVTFNIDFSKREMWFNFEIVAEKDCEMQLDIVHNGEILEMKPNVFALEKNVSKSYKMNIAK